MSALTLPWLELSILVPLAGALGIWVGRVRNPDTAYRWSLAFTGATLVCTLLTWLASVEGVAAAEGGLRGLLPRLLGRQVLAVDQFSAPLLPLVALLHFLTALATARTKMYRFSFAWLLAGESLRLGAFGCTDPWALIAVLSAATVPPYLELRQRGQPTRVYVLHMALFVGLLVAGWAFVEEGAGEASAWATVPLLLAVLIRSGTVPAHCWVTDLFERASFGGALMYVTPLAGVYAAVRLVLPVAPDWVLQGIGLASLVTAVYAAGMAAVQREARRFFAYLFLSHASLVLVGLELHTPISLTGALCLWFSVALALGGLGLTLRALEARYGRLTLSEFRGLYEHSPALAVAFLLTGLASVGFPGTLGFVAAEVLVDGAVGADPIVGVGLVVAAAVNGIAVVRAYFALFTGTRHASAVSLRITSREWFALLTLTALIVGGGLFPQPGVASRYTAAEALLKAREGTRATPPPD